MSVKSRESFDSVSLLFRGAQDKGDGCPGKIVPIAPVGVSIDLDPVQIVGKHGPPAAFQAEDQEVHQVGAQTCADGYQHKPVVQACFGYGYFHVIVALIRRAVVIGRFVGKSNADAAEEVWGYKRFVYAGAGNAVAPEDVPFGYRGHFDNRGCKAKLAVKTGGVGIVAGNGAGIRVGFGRKMPGEVVAHENAVSRLRFIQLDGFFRHVAGIVGETEHKAYLHIFAAIAPVLGHCG